MSAVKIELSDLNTSKTQRTMTSHRDLKTASSSKVLGGDQKLKDIRNTDRICMTESSEKVVFQRPPAFKISDRNKRMLTTRITNAKNLFSIQMNAENFDEDEEAKKKRLLDQAVDFKTHFSDLAHISVDRLQKQIVQLEKERHKLSEFFLEPTKEMLLQDATSMIHMEEYLSSMETCVRGHDPETAAQAKKKPGHSQ